VGEGEEQKQEQNKKNKKLDVEYRVSKDENTKES
jgi:hypothetical protein